MKILKNLVHKILLFSGSSFTKKVQINIDNLGFEPNFMDNQIAIYS